LADCTQAIPLLKNVNASAVLADKAYDTNELREWLLEQKIKAVFPPKSNRKDEFCAIFGITRKDISLRLRSDNPLMYLGTSFDADRVGKLCNERSALHIRLTTIL